ncbi:anti-sigma regulatory factor [Heliobacterium gestii]|uniref:Anti-sigma regulatory factor n=1 Tax=Heliomicrobium gestii TaxID=2699 RepID=A0A845L895_HELGE|nr:anti-sigma regulatory factor [Heliomicrobium gestii]MBM7868354.1 serine/threonine-protein kinase RsbT [Heliomicrobium gestii]MZP42438.1 anti-sigma regulatory factor [Heliomicrobium gestii]
MTQEPKCERFSVSCAQEIVTVRQRVRDCAGGLGFSRLDQTRLMTATSELARNMLDYAGGGIVLLEPIEAQGRRGLRLIFEDRGPGIADLDLAMQDGYTSGNGLGQGLPGAKRLVDDFSITSHIDEGTRIVIVRWI